LRQFSISTDWAVDFLPSILFIDILNENFQAISLYIQANYRFQSWVG